MRAMILAAGRGERLRPLTDTCPKALLKIKNKALIEYQLEALSQIGLKEIVINICYLASQIQDFVGDGRKWGVKVQYSIETHALETGGGIFQALPLLGDEPFIVLSSDIYTDFAFDKLKNRALKFSQLAHFVLIKSPSHDGDFDLAGERVINKPVYTYANIGIYRPEFFKNCTPGIFPLGPLMRQAVEAGQVSGEQYAGAWFNVGSFAILEALKS